MKPGGESRIGRAAPERSARRNVRSIYSRRCFTDSNIAIRRRPARGKLRKGNTKAHYGAQATQGLQPGYVAQSAQGQYQQPPNNYQLQAPTEPYPHCASIGTERNDRSIIIGTAAVEARRRSDADIVRTLAAQFLLRAELEVAHRGG